MKRKSFYIRGTLEERFWYKVDKGSKKKCWNWLASTCSNGYGTFGIPIGGEKWRIEEAHRISWILAHGPVSDVYDADPELWVLHKCDNKRCVNPDHLYLGTRQDNIQDAIERGRLRTDLPQQGPGEANGASRLTNEQVREIRRLYKRGGLTQWEIAQRFGTSQGHVSRIVLRKEWAHI